MITLYITGTSPVDIMHNPDRTHRDRAHLHATLPTPKHLSTWPCLALPMLIITLYSSISPYRHSTFQSFTDAPTKHNQALSYFTGTVRSYTSQNRYAIKPYLTDTFHHSSSPSPTYTKIRRMVGHIIMPHHRTTSSFDVTTKRSYASASRYSV
jgi:hypothetical protein